MNIEIQALSAHIIESANNEWSSDSDFFPTLDMIAALRGENKLFSCQIAKTVFETRKISEKQSVCIAKDISGNPSMFPTFFRFLPSECYTGSNPFVLG